MTDRTWVVLLLIPAPLYVAGRFLIGFSPDSAAIPLGFAVALSFGLATSLGLLRSPWLVWAGEVALLLVVLVAILPTSPAGMGGFDLAAGVMLGGPFVGLGGAWRSRYSPASRLATLEFTLFVGVWYLAAVPSVAAHGGPLSGLEFFDAISQVLVLQAQGLVATFTGGWSTAALPFAGSLDPAFVGLAAVALLGVMITTLAPRTALDEPLPWGWTALHRSEGDRGTAVPPGELREGQNTVLATRSRPRTPESAVPPGAASLALAGFAIVLLMLGAIYLPLYFLFALTLAVTALVVVMIALWS
ncbi:MAG: hypothetical protein ABSB97_09150, partial [Thermoplasmata archaeon]